MTTHPHADFRRRWARLVPAAFAALLLVLAPAAGNAESSRDVADAPSADLLALPSLPTSPAARAARCRAPASLSGFFRPVGSIVATRVGCARARWLVGRFPRFCAKAYAAQGACTIRVGVRWRCAVRMVGSLERGAPARAVCRRNRASVSFTVAYFPPTEPVVHGQSTWVLSGSALRPFSLKAAGLPATVTPAVGPFDERRNCIQTTPAGEVVPPASAEFQLHLVGTSRAVGQGLQRLLVARRVTAILREGLRSRTNPTPLPIFLTSGAFDRAFSLGVHANQCANRALKAIAMRTNEPSLRGATAAHELYHAYSFALEDGVDTWWEEASATWFEGKAGFPEATLYDRDLQFPQKLDTPPGGRTTYPYAMSRFVQFLEGRGFVNWPMQIRMSVGRDTPGPTEALAANLSAAGTTLGAQLAAFWGDRLKARPAHGPQLVPVRANSRHVTVRPGRRTVPVATGPLETNVVDFELSENVARVEFEFRPGDGEGYFWGLVRRPNDSRRFRSGESVSFCVGGGEGDDVEWPGHFPVTHTNGQRIGNVTGEIVVFAQADSAQCRPPSPANRACSLLRRARVGQVLGSGTFPVATVSRGDNPRQWTCFYVGERVEARLDVARHKESSQRVRDHARRLIRSLELQPLDLGDVAGIGTISGGERTTRVVAMAVGREVALLMVAGSRNQILTVARRIAGELGP